MAPANKALLIGIDCYPNLGRPWQLHGSVRDVRAMEEYLLEELGFRAADVRVLCDEQASREAIIGAFERLIRDSSDDDLVVVHYSGHGSKTEETSLAGGDDEDETIVPADSGRGRYPNRDIASTQLRELLMRLSEKTRRLTLIFDCCHSGTITRDPFAARTRGVPPAPLPDTLPTRWRDTKRERAGEPRYDQRYTLLTACRSDEKAAEMILKAAEELHVGAFTHHLLKELHRAPAGATYRDVMEVVGLAVSGLFPNQHPQLEGVLDRKLFDVEERRPMRYVSVRDYRPSSRCVYLGAGLLQGVGRGSIWEVYPGGVRSLETGATPVGRLEVTALRAGSSEATLLGDQPAPAELCAGARAIEIEGGNAALRVEVVTHPGREVWAGRLFRELEASPLLEQVGEKVGAHLRIYLLSPRQDVTDDDPVPALGSIGEPCYAVVSAEGRLIMPVRSLEDRHALNDLVENLEGRARWVRARELCNRSDDTLAGLIKFEILRFQNGSWLPAHQENESMPIFEHGERFAVRMKHRYSAPLHLYLIDFSADGVIDPIYPAEGAREEIAPGREITYGVEGGDDPRFLYPRNSVYQLDGVARGAIETLKVLATTEAADLNPLFQGSYRSIRGWRSLYGRSTVGRLLCRALAGTSRREIERLAEPLVEPWTTVERSVWVRSPGVGGE